MPAAPARHPALHRPRQSMPPKFLTAVPAAVHKRIFMTADQDTPVAASAAPDTMEKETPKPRRRAARRNNHRYVAGHSPPRGSRGRRNFQTRSTQARRRQTRSRRHGGPH